MSESVAALLIEAGIILILAFLLGWVLLTTARERERLYNRLQAGTLRDYAMARPLVESVDEESYAPPRQRPEAEAEIIGPTTISAEDMASGSDAFERLTQA